MPALEIVSKAVDRAIVQGEINMATKPKVITGSHSIRTEYPDGRVEFESDWDKLKADVEQALAEFALTKGSEVSVKPKKTRKKKTND